LRGGAVFLSFFILFTLASLAVPVPLFPGNMFPTWFGVTSANYSSLFSAVVNGATYGFLVWLVFVVATRSLDESGVAGYDGKKSRSRDSNKRRAGKH
jgi:hypothetical protein